MDDQVQRNELSFNASSLEVWKLDFTPFVHDHELSQWIMSRFSLNYVTKMYNHMGDFSKTPSWDIKESSDLNLFIQSSPYLPQREELNYCLHKFGESDQCVLSNKAMIHNLILTSVLRWAFGLYRRLLLKAEHQWERSEEQTHCAPY